MKKRNFVSQLLNFRYLDPETIKCDCDRNGKNAGTIAKLYIGPGILFSFSIHICNC